MPPNILMSWIKVKDCTEQTKTSILGKKLDFKDEGELRLTLRLDIQKSRSEEINLLNSSRDTTGRGKADRLPKWQKERLLIVFFSPFTSAIYQNGDEKLPMRCSFEIATDGGIKKNPHKRLIEV